MTHPDLTNVRQRLAAVTGEQPHLADIADALLLLLPPDLPGWHSVLDQNPVDGAWTAGTDEVTVAATDGRVHIEDMVYRHTRVASPAEARAYAAALLSAAARADQTTETIPGATP